MRPTDFISLFALFLAIFASIFSVITFVKELHIEEKMRHLHQHNLNITTILRLDKDIHHLFRTLGMENNRAERLRMLLQINANKTSNFTEGKRRPSTTPHGVFPGNIKTEISTAPTGKSTNTGQEKN